MNLQFSLGITAVFGLILNSPSAWAFDVTENFSIGGVIAGVVQCQDLSAQPPGAIDDSSTCEGTAPIQPEISWRPTDADELFVKFGFGIDNGINATTSLLLAPWAADLEDDVKNINGRDRDHLLTAWYKHTFEFSNDSSLGITLGIIDATDYLDENAYANDEYTQFMNEALVNGPNVFLPSYDRGAAIEWERGPWSLKGAYMHVGEKSRTLSGAVSSGFDFYAAQLGYKFKSNVGEGNYRLLILGASSDFLDPTETRFESRSAILVSADQEFSEQLGGWIRFGIQDDAAAIDYESLLSGGINIKGPGWGRPDDNIGIGYAHLTGGNGDIDSAEVLEGYYRFVFNDNFALTADAQYQKGDLTDGSQSKGWVFSLRATAEF